MMASVSRLVSIVAVVFTCWSCGSDSPSTPSRAASTTTTTIPVTIQAANFQYGSGTLLCQTGFCATFTMAVTNIGPGCATNVQVTVFWYGSDGAVLLPNTPTITMGAPGGLSTILFRPGTTIVVSSLGGFNDVRSAHTVYRASGTWTNVPC